MRELCGGKPWLMSLFRLGLLLQWESIKTYNYGLHNTNKLEPKENKGTGDQLSLSKQEGLKNIYH